jgi:hypothetical protein
MVYGLRPISFLISGYFVMISFVRFLCGSASSDHRNSFCNGYNNFSNAKYKPFSSFTEMMNGKSSP